MTAWDTSIKNSLFVLLGIESLNKEIKDHFLNSISDLAQHLYLDYVLNKLSPEDGGEFLILSGDEETSFRFAEKKIPNLKEELKKLISQELETALTA